MKAVFVCLIALLAVASATTWTDCTKAGSPAKPSNVQLSPDPPQRSVDCKVSLNGTVSESLNGGQVQLSIVYLGVTVHSQTNNVCDVVKCPLSGPFSAAVTVPGSAIPSFSPPGSYTGHGVVTDQNNQPIICVDVHFQLN
eukprot:TRINITY_DN2116_c0_g1_i4.p2 TRINITY_DN2116_c0_g1~~TRINITY_DN2116_c0_g1_i4.p2  ORF type:complete len:140 (-),score=58.93 TRINITY_DN2116_c0_g1_i4:101-520(-)